MSRAWQKLQSSALGTILRQHHPAIHHSVKFIGKPFLQLIGPEASISIGQGSSLVSLTERTALGLHHPVNIRAITPGAQVIIGARVGISGGTFVAARRIEIGNDCLIGANVTICDTDFHPLNSLNRTRAPLPTPEAGDEVTLGNNVFVGTGAIILKGTRIGDNSIVGAGAVVKGKFPAGVIIAGNPARIIKEILFTEDDK